MIKVIVKQNDCKEKIEFNYKKLNPNTTIREDVISIFNIDTNFNTVSDVYFSPLETKIAVMCLNTEDFYDFLQDAKIITENYINPNLHTTDVTVGRMTYCKYSSVTCGYSYHGFLVSKKAKQSKNYNKNLEHLLMVLSNNIIHIQ